MFKWQREYWNITEPLDSHLNAITNLTLRVTDGNEGRTIWLDDLRSNSDYLTTPGGSTITSSTGSRYFQYRALLHSFDEAVSATLSAVTVDYTLNSAPGIPTLDSPANTATGQPLLAVLKTTGTDAQSDYLRYKIEICTNVDMTANCQTFNQVSSQTGWSGQNTQSNTAYTSGTQATYTLQTTLTGNTTYYWRSYAIDPSGTNSFGSTQATPYSFTTNVPPGTPTLDAPTNTAISQSTTPLLRTTATDTESDYLRYKIEICTNVGMSANCQTFNQVSSQTGWSGQNTQSNTAYTSGTQATYTVQTPLSVNTTYYWRSYAIDPAGSNIFGATQGTPFSFTTNQPPSVPVLDLPIDFDTGVLLSAVLKTTGTDVDSDYLRYKIDICTNVGMTANCQTFNQVSSQTGWSGQNTDSGLSYTSGTQATYTIQTPLIQNTTYFWRSYAIDPGGSNIFGATQGTPHSFTTNINPNVPSLDLPTDADTGLSITPILKTTGADLDTDYLRYKIQLCTNLSMTLNCQTFDQTSSQTGWSGQNTQSNTAYTSGTQASYTIQTALIPNITYFWRTYAIDPGGTNAFGSTQATPYSFTTIPNPTQASACLVEKNSFNTQIIVRWRDNSTAEAGYQIWKVTDGGTPEHLTPDLSPNVTEYTDTTVASNHTYGYLIRSFQYDGSNTLYSDWCPTATSNLSTGGFTIF
ncbi:MAG: hypothetical protein UV68_C0055G0002 [Candidatus Collierbacteria bacterium GW2011_GWC2_43_12]|uniref:Fibronectin type-III domain-containing protein n=1 Tax=Candidatus Collierbacteria bacterium GW2011_GWC2_43_12 TaxID=1618390 RepID=A0A0G1D2M0_9BACT|nr:MAG: hypothetical protein UV68_C0055G0002 [Candidatus Collierbacteria bacterium GW2011_GWC2_43_12]